MTVMEILVNPVVQKLLGWGSALTIGGYAVKKFTSILMDLKDAAIRFLDARITEIRDPEIQTAARVAVRYVAKRLPDATDDEKLQAAIKFAQDHTPDILISDERVKIAIESAYTAFKADLLKISEVAG